MIMTLQWWIGVVCLGWRNFPLDVTFVELLHKSWPSDSLKSSCRHSYYNVEQWPIVSPALFYIVQLRDWFTTVTHDRFLSVCLMINEHLLRRFWDVIHNKASTYAQRLEVVYSTSRLFLSLGNRFLVCAVFQIGWKPWVKWKWDESIIVIGK